MNATIPTPSNYCMRFGRHRGKLVSELSTEYIRTLLSKCTLLYEETRAILQEELDNRTRPDIQSNRRRVIDSERHRVTSPSADNRYGIYYQVLLECGHRECARPVKNGKCPMTVTCRKVGEVIVVGSNIRITVVSVQGEKVRIGVTAPKDVTVDRQEIHEKKQEFVNEWNDSDIYQPV